MKIENIEIEYFIDYLERKVHLREIPTANPNLVNVIGTTFQYELICREFLLSSVLDFDWVIYAPNGLILNFKKHSLNIVSKTEEWLHRPFMDRLKAK